MSSILWQTLLIILNWDFFFYLCLSLFSQVWRTLVNLKKNHPQVCGKFVKMDKKTHIQLCWILKLSPWTNFEIFPWPPSGYQMNGSGSRPRRVLFFFVVRGICCNTGQSNLCPLRSTSLPVFIHPFSPRLWLADSGVSKFWLDEHTCSR